MVEERQSPKEKEKPNLLAEMDTAVNMSPPKPFVGKQQGNYYYHLGLTFRRYMEHCTDIHDRFNPRRVAS